MVISGECFASGFEEEAYFGWGVCGGDEGSLELAGREPDAGFEERSVEASEGDGVRGGSGGEVGDWLVGEKPGEHGAYAVGCERYTVFMCDASHSAGDEFGRLFEPVVDVFLMVDEVAEGSDPCGHGERVSAEGSRLIDGAKRGEVLHDVGASAEGAAGEATADDFAEGRDVRCDAVDLLRSAKGEAEAGHHLVEEEERAVGCGDLAQAFQIAGIRRDGSGVADDWFDDDAGNVVRAGGEDGGDGVEVVEGQRKSVHCGLSGYACGPRNAEGGDSAAGFDEHGVGVAVVAALEFDDEVASCKSSCKANGGHAGLGTRGDEAELLDGRKAVGDELGQVGFGGDGSSEAGSFGDSLLNGLDDGREGVAEDHRPPGAEEVEIAVVVFVVEPGAFGSGEERWVSANGSEGADGGVYPAGEVFFGALLQMTGTGEAARHI